LGLVVRERKGEAIDRIAFREITKMLLDLGINSRAVYEEDFERPFLEASATFYRTEASEFIAVNTCPEYLKRVRPMASESLHRI
jgi:cullin 3